MWILSKMRLWKCEFFLKNDTSRIGFRGRKLGSDPGNSWASNQTVPFPRRSWTCFPRSDPSDRTFATAWHCKCWARWLPENPVSSTLPGWIWRDYCKWRLLWVEKNRIRDSVHGKRRALVLSLIFGGLVWPPLLGIAAILWAACCPERKSRRFSARIQPQRCPPSK